MAISKIYRLVPSDPEEITYLEVDDLRAGDDDHGSKIQIKVVDDKQKDMDGDPIEIHLWLTGDEMREFSDALLELLDGPVD